MFNSSKIFEIYNPSEFNALALQIFRFQAQNCDPYRKFIALLNINPLDVRSIHEIPFLPIELFKQHAIYTSMHKPDLFFTSSGTTGLNTSTHYVHDASVYEQSILTNFGSFFGSPQKYCILGLLPGYLERKESSLVYMVNFLQQHSNHHLNGNFLTDFDTLNERLCDVEKTGQATLLFGVSFALLDFGEKYPMHLKHTTLIETGGMKGRRQEITREELHSALHGHFGKSVKIVSEYGMTELLSQAWYMHNAFECPPWMKALVRDKNDPLQIGETGSGGLNIIDLANVYSCSFLATGDVGTVYANGTFTVLGRLDNTDLRGCNLLHV